MGGGQRGGGVKGFRVWRRDIKNRRGEKNIAYSRILSLLKVNRRSSTKLNVHLLPYMLSIYMFVICQG